MKGKFHKTVLSVSAMLIAFMFASCGDESSTSADEDSVKKDESSVESVSDLGECDETLEGESKFVTEDSTNYTCTSGKWEQDIDTDDDEKSSSSKKGETAASSSSEKKAETSSSKKGETAASSSSAKKAETSSSKKEETAASSSSAKKAETSSSKKEETAASSSSAKKAETSSSKKEETAASSSSEEKPETSSSEKATAASSSSEKKPETSSSKKEETAASSSSAKKAETSSSKKEETAASSSSEKKPETSSSEKATAASSSSEELPETSSSENTPAESSSSEELPETSSSEPEDEGIIKPDGYYQTNCPGGNTCSYISTDYLTPSATYGEFLSTDNKVYKTVKIGSQVWMAQNIPSVKCNNDKCWTLGGRNPCPEGWHLPSKSEFETLLANTSGAALKSTTGWTECALSEGSNSSGFSAPADGYYYRTWTGTGWYGDYYGIGSNANFWTSSIEGSEGYVLTIDCDGNTSFTIYDTEEMYASSRCILDEEN